MPDVFLHGVATVQNDEGIRPIQTVKSSTVGFVGTAPLATGDVKATLTTGTLNGAILFTSKLVGALGNAVKVRLRDPASVSAALSVAVAGNEITVNLATSAGSVVTSTAAQVIAAVVAFPAAFALVNAANAPGSTGASVVVGTPALVALTGGVDEPFPLNKPVLVTGPRQAEALGATGTLRDAYSAAYAQGINSVVVVRVAAGVDDAASAVNVLGSDVASTGVYALLTSGAVTGQVPKILAAPGWTSTPAASPANPITLALIVIANRLRGVVIADGPNTTEADAYTDRAKFGSDRLYIVDPMVKVFDSVTGIYTNRPASAFAAGALSKSDITRGFWWSPSNQIIEGISGTARPIQFALNSIETEANRLNEKGIATVVQANGFRLWGNRNCGADQLWAFLSVRRAADAVFDSTEQALLWAMDRPFSVQLLLDIRDTVQEYINSLIVRGALIGGLCTIDPERNSATNLAAGKLAVDYRFEPPAPLENLTLYARRDTSYYTELVSQLATAS
jgi:uncharacterized protein